VAHLMQAEELERSVAVGMESGTSTVPKEGTGRSWSSTVPPGTGRACVGRGSLAAMSDGDDASAGASIRAGAFCSGAAAVVPAAATGPVSPVMSVSDERLLRHDGLASSIVGEVARAANVSIGSNAWARSSAQACLRLNELCPPDPTDEYQYVYINGRAERGQGVLPRGAITHEHGKIFQHLRARWSGYDSFHTDIAREGVRSKSYGVEDYSDY
jgi:hypothetical protein